MTKKKGLGKGLDTLFSDSGYLTENDAYENEGSVSTVRISDIEPDKNQPRKIFTDESLESLAQSIERHGVLQPLVVRRIKTDDTSAASKLLGQKYTIISGERRWRASKLAGLTEVPVVIKDISDTEVAAIMLVENLQREDLNPVEQAQGLRRLTDEFGLTQEETAAIVGISRPALTNALRLLNLPDEVLDVLAHGDISSGHARALLSLGNEDDILTALQTVVGKELSVRETEKLVKNIIKEKNKSADDNRNLKQKEREIYIASLEEKISSKLGRKSFITNSKKNDGSGKLEIEYYSTEDLEALLKNLCGNNIFE